MYAHGFLWYMDYNDFRIFDADFGLINMWLSFGLNPVDAMRISFKVSHTWTTPNTAIEAVDNLGSPIMDHYLFDEKLDFRLQISCTID